MCGRGGSRFSGHEHGRTCNEIPQGSNVLNHGVITSDEEGVLLVIAGIFGSIGDCWVLGLLGIALLCMAPCVRHTT